MTFKIINVLYMHRERERERERESVCVCLDFFLKFKILYNLKFLKEVFEKNILPKQYIIMHAYREAFPVVHGPLMFHFFFPLTDAP